MPTDKVHLRDYVLMAPPGGGEPEEVSTAGDAISLKMVQGYRQVEPKTKEKE